MNQQAQASTIRTYCVYRRRPTIPARVGQIVVGGDAPLQLQSMANVSTMETDLCVQQALRCAEQGADLFRYTAQGVREAEHLQEIARSLRSEYGCDMPLVADIHFRSEPAFVALQYVDKVRINPGNFLRHGSEVSDEQARTEICERFGAFVLSAKELGRAIRIGVNHGSLSERILSRYGNTAEGLVVSCMEYLDVCHDLEMNDVVISMKASNVLVMNAAARLLVEQMEAKGYRYPLHLGVTEAGEGEDGRIKSTIGIGSLLVDGIGDTLRVSLSEEPEEELRFGRKLIDYVGRVAAYSEEHPIFNDFSKSECLLTHRSSSSTQQGGVLTVSTVSGGREPFDASYVEGVLRLSDGSSHPVVSIDLDSSLDRLYHRIETLAEQTFSKDLWVELRGGSPDYLYKVRYSVDLLRKFDCHPSILLHYTSEARGYDELLIESSIQLGSILLQGVGSAIALSSAAAKNVVLLLLLNGLLQAVRIKMTHTEFISCPGCGRTLFDLQTTVAEVKKRLGHLPDLKIGVMGCIVNGPGEMADADYGYVGGGVGRVDLYRGQERLLRAIPTEDAVDQLIALIKADGRWVEPSNGLRE